jgi:hypothetical protein
MALRAEVGAYSRFLLGLPRFLRETLSLDAARKIVLTRLRSRNRNFLELAKQSVYANPKSPYLGMLRQAGCEFADLERLVHRDGLEGTLSGLRAAGVYVTFEEFKGLEPIVRGGREIPAESEHFDNPHLTQYHTIGTGGSTGRSRRVLMDLDHLRARLPLIRLGEEVHGTFHMPSAFWFEIPPGNGLDSVLQRVPLGNPPERWFTPIRGSRDGSSARFRMATTAAITVARLSGAKVPYPEYLPLERAGVIAEWAAGALKRRGACVLRAHVSKALRVALAAREKGIDLTGAVFCSGGEPPSPAKVAGITGAGARFYSNYYFTEAGPVGMSCTHTTDPNDQHLFLDHLALIQAPRAVPGFDLEVSAFHFTTLLPSAPKVLLNVESDDFGVVEDRACGCPFGALGFTTHVRDIRSFRKLTGEGVTLIGSDMEHILEDVLPGRFGGSHLDYQVVEEEDERGFTRLTLVVAPHLQLPDDAVVVDAVHGELARRGGGAEMSRGLWSQAATLRVRREEPRVSSRGKWIPLRVERGVAATPRRTPVVEENVTS